MIAVFLAFEMSSMLVGGSLCPNRNRRSGWHWMAQSIDRVIHLKTLHVGPDELLVAAKVAIGGG